MNVARPYAAVAPGVEGDVLVALDRTTRALTGRNVARLVPHRSASAVNEALDRLVSQGIVWREQAGRAWLYTLNREHVAYPAVANLAHARTEFLSRLRELFNDWGQPPTHASLYGSAARADGDIDSDIDILLIRQAGVSEDDETWSEQVAGLSERVVAWAGNELSVVDFSSERLTELGEPSFQPMLDHGILLHGAELKELLAGGTQ